MKETMMSYSIEELKEILRALNYCAYDCNFNNNSTIIKIAEKLSYELQYYNDERKRILKF